jgi:hypothetical protein
LSSWIIKNIIRNELRTINVGILKEFSYQLVNESTIVVREGGKHIDK